MPRKPDYAKGSPPPLRRRGGASGSVIQSTPCYMSEDFFELERKLWTAIRGRSQTQRSIRVHEIEDEVAAKFCDGCWFKSSCRQWAEDNSNFEGFAAGKSYFEWRDRLMPLEHALKAQEQRYCKCHDEPMTRNGIDKRTGRVSWRCSVSVRARGRRWRESPGGRAYYANKDNRSRKAA